MLQDLSEMKEHPYLSGRWNMQFAFKFKQFMWKFSVTKN